MGHRVKPGRSGKNITGIKKGVQVNMNTILICECEVPGRPLPNHGECSKCGYEMLDREPTIFDQMIEDCNVFLKQSDEFIKKIKATNVKLEELRKENTLPIITAPGESK